MLEIICPSCRAGNDPINQFCGQCGGRLQRNALVTQAGSGSHITIGKTRLPVQQVKQVGVSLAVSLATLLAEATLAWARRRLEDRLNRPSAGLSLVRRPPAEDIQTPAMPVETPPPTVTIVRERIVEVHRWGRPVQRFIERMAWKREG